LRGRDDKPNPRRLSDRLSTAFLPDGLGRRLVPVRGRRFFSHDYEQGLANASSCRYNVRVSLTIIYLGCENSQGLF